MSKTRFWLWFSIAIILFSHCAIRPGLIEEQQIATPSSRSVRQLQRQITEAVQAQNLQSAFIGIYIEEAQSHQVLYSFNAHKLLMPASNQKIITSAAALSLLKPEFRFKTQLYLRGDIREDTLFGDLLVKGAGDPTIKSLTVNDTTPNFFREVIHTLKNLGIKQIKGSLLMDASAFENRWGESWCWDDLWYYYSAKPSAFVLNDNCLDLLIIPSNSCGAPPKVITQPLANFYQLNNRLVTIDSTGKPNYDFFRKPGNTEIIVWGEIPQRKDTLHMACTVDNPALFFGEYFRTILSDSGIIVNSVDINMDRPLDYTNSRAIMEYTSPPLKQIIVTLNKVSHNLYAEQLLRTLGWVYGQKGTAEAGITVVRSWLGSIGLDTNMIFMSDGSGLARTNLVTPLAIATVLRTMHQSPYWGTFRESLPIGGVDGTLKNRLRNSNASGHVFAKTGYIGRVRALSGYIQARNGREYIFSIIANHYPVPTSVVNELQDRIVTLLYNFESEL